jgi:eukaryotic-like serine/threonine-protein kinase
MGLSTGTRLGPYEILSPLGAGGMGEVYRAKDTRLGRQVAVKILPESVAHDLQRVARFEKEARALAALSHPNVLGIHDVGSSDGRYFAVTELLEGETLRDRLTGERTTWRKAAEIAAAIADGLAAAHSAGIVHRDLKPENVFLTSDGRVKILDFGLAKAAEPVSGDAVTLTSPAAGSLSTAGEVVGTLSYMAPEQLCARKLDGRADIFALGGVLYEMLSGRRPFDGASAADTIAAILRADAPPLGSIDPPIPPAVAGIVLRCLEKRPEDRYDTAHDLAIALRSIRDVSPAVPESRPRTRRWILLAAPVAGAGLLVAAVLWTRDAIQTVPRSPGGPWSAARRFTSAPGWEAEPALSPDGTLVAYTANASGRSEIWVVDPDGGEPLRLTDGPGANHNPAWLPDGRALAFASTRDGAASIWRISRLGGSATLLIDGADTPAVSPDGMRIAFTRPGPGGKSRIWVAPIADPSRARRLTSDSDGDWNHMDPAWSPDGRTICYSDFRNLWLVSSDGGKAVSLSSDGVADREPAFSSDGAFVYFSSHRIEPQSIWRVAAGGGPVERVLAGTGTSNHPSIARDGQRLVYSSAALDIDVVVADRKTSNVCRIGGSRNDVTPGLSPDGRSLAYVSDRLGTSDLWLESLDSGCPGARPAQRLTQIQPGPSAPVFSPDGRWIAFFQNVRGVRTIWAVATDGTAPAKLVDSGAGDFHPAFAPDGNALVFVSHRGGGEHVWVLPLRSGSPAGDAWQLTDGEETDVFPAWSPDGSRIAFIRAGDVWIVDARHGAAPRRLTSGAEPHHLAWEPGGSALLASGMFGTAALHLRTVHVTTGKTEVPKPRLVLGDRSSPGYFSLSRDGRYLAADVTETKGNLWSSSASRDGR